MLFNQLLNTSTIHSDSPQSSVRLIYDYNKRDRVHLQSSDIFNAITVLGVINTAISDLNLTPEQIDKLNEILSNIDNLVTQDQLKAVIATIPDASKLATKIELQEVKNSIPSVVDFVTNTILASQLASTTITIQNWSNARFALQSDVSLINSQVTSHTADISANKTAIKLINDKLVGISTTVSEYVGEVVSEAINNLDVTLFLPVAELPAEGRTNKIYLVPIKEGSTDTNKWMEWVWVRKPDSIVYAWESIGSITVDTDFTEVKTWVGNNFVSLTKTEEIGGVKTFKNSMRANENIIVKTDDANFAPNSTRGLIELYPSASSMTTVIGAFGESKSTDGTITNTRTGGFWFSQSDLYIEHPSRITLRGPLGSSTTTLLVDGDTTTNGIALFKKTVGITDVLTVNSNIIASNQAAELRMFGSSAIIKVGPGGVSNLSDDPVTEIRRGIINLKSGIAGKAGSSGISSINFWDDESAGTNIPSAFIESGGGYNLNLTNNTGNLSAYLNKVKIATLTDITTTDTATRSWTTTLVNTTKTNLETWVNTQISTDRTAQTNELKTWSESMFLKLAGGTVANITVTGATSTGTLLIGGKVAATQEYVDNAVGAIGIDLFIIVTTLPATGVANKIYLLKSASPTTNNEYEEWIWVNSKWELIGSLRVDLTGVATEAWVLSKDYIDNTKLNSALAVKVNNDGTGASGTWGISITGNAATATTATTATTANKTQQALTFTGGSTSSFNGSTALSIPIPYAWAQASSKPSYAFSEITGNVAIAQIPDLSNTYVTTGTAQDISGVKTFTGTINANNGIYLPNHIGIYGKNTIGANVNIAYITNGNNAIFGNPGGITYLYSSDASIYHNRAGTQYAIWDAANSNLSTVNWAAKDITAAGTLTVTGNITQTNGLIYSTYNGIRVTIGAQNTTGVHIYASAGTFFAFDRNLIPAAPNTLSIGTSGSYWNAAYVTNATVANIAASTLSVTGTTTLTGMLNANGHITLPTGYAIYGKNSSGISKDVLLVTGNAAIIGHVDLTATIRTTAVDILHNRAGTAAYPILDTYNFTSYTLPIENIPGFQDYHQVVLGLHPLTNTDASAEYFSRGTMTLGRKNGLYAGGILSYSSQKRYATTNAWMSLYGNVGWCKPCTFTYNGIKYAGLKVYYQAAQVSGIKISGQWTSAPFYVSYYNSDTKEIYNSEVYNSIVEEGPDISLRGLYSNTNMVYDQSNANLSTVDWTMKNATVNGTLSVDADIQCNGSFQAGQMITAYSIMASQYIQITGTTESTGTTNGALVVTGGVGVGGSLYAGKQSVFEKNVIIRDGLWVTGKSTIDGTLKVTGTSSVDGGFSATENITADGTIYIKGKEVATKEYVDTLIASINTQLRTLGGLS